MCVLVKISLNSSLPFLYLSSVCYIYLIAISKGCWVPDQSQPIQNDTLYIKYQHCQSNIAKLLLILWKMLILLFCSYIFSQIYDPFFRQIDKNSAWRKKIMTYKHWVFHHLYFINTIIKINCNAMTTIYLHLVNGILCIVRNNGLTEFY